MYNYVNIKKQPPDSQNTDNLSPEIANIRSCTALALLPFSLASVQMPHYGFVQAISETLLIWKVDTLNISFILRSQDRNLTIDF